MALVVAPADHRDETLIDATESIHEPLENGFRFGHNLGKPLQRTSAPEFLGIVDDHLDAKDAFAFGLDLQSQLAAVQLEDRQIIRRSLDRDFPFG
ncbi:MAG TPA: hypothetical protein VMR62_15125 [Bryobacteraceae bacterium]|jgi:hypothetical protein|nr:hypothetical protein [Bryobacteraceae bacterium]